MATSGEQRRALSVLAGCPHGCTVANMLAHGFTNAVLNGLVRFRTSLLPPDPSDQTLAQIRRSGAWIVAKVDSRHPAARERTALAMTVGGAGFA